MQYHPDIVIILEQILKADGLPIQIKSGIEDYITDPENIRSQENLVYHLVDLELIATDNEIIDDKPLYKIAILFLNKLINGENNTSKLSLFFLYLALCHLELGDHRCFLVIKNKLFASTTGYCFAIRRQNHKSQRNSRTFVIALFAVLFLRTPNVY